MRKAESVVPTMAKVRIVPRFLKKYFCRRRQRLRWNLKEQPTTHPLQAVPRVENDRRENDVEENLRIERRFEVDLIQISHQLTSKRVRVRVVLRRCRVIESSGKSQPETVRRQALIVFRSLFSLDSQMSRGRR
jgi:hypothetical protein